MFDSLKRHWPEYLIEACGLAVLTCAVCSFAILLFHPGSPAVAAIPGAIVRHMLMGLVIAGTSLAMVHSRWGKQSGAHFNPAVTLSYHWLGRIGQVDAAWYGSAHLAGALLGVSLMAFAWRENLGHPLIHYTASQPGMWGSLITWAVEFAVSGLLMTTILSATNSRRFARCAGLFTAVLTVVNVSVLVPLVGTSLNPARWLASAIPAHAWVNLWLYLTAAPLGTLIAAYAYVRRHGRDAVFCAKLHHVNSQRCIFCETRAERALRIAASSCNLDIAAASNRQIASATVIGPKHEPESITCPH